MEKSEPADHAATPTQGETEYGSMALSEVLRNFGAGHEVPGSGSANALTAALAACLTASVAVKTQNAKTLKYIHVRQTATDVERRARALAIELQKLLDEDSTAFAPVIALRRETGSITDSYRQDQSLRNEVAALKPATEIPVQIARLALRTGELALDMLDSGFAAARGEAYTALAQAISAIDGALFVARLNVRTIRQRAGKLNDVMLEAAWIERTLREIGAIRIAAKELHVRAALADTALDASLATPPEATPIVIR